jgi:methionyl-tRNA synthetase
MSSPLLTVEEWEAKSRTRPNLLPIILESQEMKESFYITTPIYYSNSLPHLGHLYTTIVADTIARFNRQLGKDVFFLTGTDEHGINIQRAAEKLNRTPKEHTDYISKKIAELFDDFRLSTEFGGYDIFMRTTSEFHYRGAQNFWKKIASAKTPKGNSPIYKGFYSGWFCPPCAAYKSEEETYIPDGSDIPYCLIHEKPLEKVSEESYFFRLSDYEELLIETIEKNPDLVRPESRRNEVLSFIKQGLQDLSISREKRSVSWGIPVPDDEEHVMYVWLDALSNYITALGFGNERQETGLFEKYWKAAHHIVGKDIIRFHTVYWFSFLSAAGLSLPKAVFAHGMWLDAEGRKMGKTLGNTIDVEILKKYFQRDAVRYFVLREMVFGQDGRFSYEALIDRANSDLAGGLGNLVSRTISMIEKYCNGLIPDGKISEQNYIYARRAGIDPDGLELVSFLTHSRDEFLRKFKDFEVHSAIEIAWKIIAKIDKMISDSKPWSLAKDSLQVETLRAVLYRSTEVIRWLAVMLYPVLPESSPLILKSIGISEPPQNINPQNLKWGELVPGQAVSPQGALFPRLDKEKTMSEIQSNQSETSKSAQSIDSIGSENKSDTAAAASTPQMDQYITIDDFAKIEMRVGKILSAERVPNADKLLKFEIDLGEEKPRQILAGLAEYYVPEELLGRSVVVVANLKPRKMRGLESQGMILAASLDAGDRPAIATFLDEVKPGARLK